MRIGKYESSDSTAGTAITFLLIGLGVGAALGLLLAPKTGRQLRKDLRRSYDEASRRLPTGPTKRKTAWRKWSKKAATSPTNCGPGPSR